MQNMHSQKGLYGRLLTYKILKLLKLNGTNKSAPKLHFNASDGSRVVNVNLGSNTPSSRWWFINDSANYSYIIQHNGWNYGSNADNVIKGLVFRLPGSKGFLAGWALENGQGGVEKTLFGNEYQAVIHADYLAKKEAEASRKYAVIAPSKLEAA